LACSDPGTAADFHVSPSGDDGSPGTLAAPWRTVRKAASTVPAGSTVFLRGGIYRERVEIAVSGNAVDGPVVFRAFPGEEPVIDGTGLAFDPGGATALLAIRGRSHLRIEGITFRNHRSAVRDLVPVGILVEGDSHHLEIVDNVIHGIETWFNGPDGGDAHGIAVFGTGTDPIHDLLIAGNELFGLKLGSSEALVLNGNVTAFTVRDNVVRDCNNIGIDFIGYEGTAPDPSLDRARDGVCRGNLVFNIDSSRNPAYGGTFSRGGGDRSAGGIYVDGGARIVVEGNVVHHCNIGIELASEHVGRATAGITLRNNLLYQNDIGGIFLGGYDALRGSTEDCRVLNNTLFDNDTRRDGNGEVYLQYDVRNCVFLNNLLHANGQGLLFGNPWVQNSGNVVDNQLFFAPGGAEEWQWKKVYRTTLAAHRLASGNDANSLLADPLFRATASHDFRLAAGSPGRNAADPAFVPAPGESDLTGLARVAEGRVDHGAIEYRAAPPGAVTVVIGNGFPIANRDDTPSTDDGTDFGELVWWNGTPVTREFVVENTGSEPFRPVHFAFEGHGASAFFLLRTFAVLPAGETRRLRVAFVPGSAGVFGADLVMSGASRGEAQYRFALTGTGLAPDHLPDEQVGLRPDRLRGDGIYHRNGAGQTEGIVLGRAARAWFRTENDGALPDRIRLEVSPAGRFFEAAFFSRQGGARRNITAGLVTGREQAALDAGTGRNDECRILRTGADGGRGFLHHLAMTARSRSDRTRVDRVILRVRGRQA
ncbi:MAG: right-handed parallel beta-helix repeat-containing protein, partial [Verrucomicrobia bacterium]|nr:right-handed parallel beta-helix repeat-containing protein [Verrucomicrobiota bacterium]